MFSAANEAEVETANEVKSREKATINTWPKFSVSCPKLFIKAPWEHLSSYCRSFTAILFEILPDITQKIHT